MAPRAASILTRLSTVSVLLVLSACQGANAGSALPQIDTSSEHAPTHVSPRALEPAIIVANYGGGSIAEFALDAKGNAAPGTVIEGKRTKIEYVDNVALDKDDRIYASINANAIGIYGAGAHDNAKPIGTISGGNTGIVFPIGVAVDSSGYVYVADCGTGKVDIFNPGSTGNVFPVNTHQFPSCVVSLAIDAHDRMYVTWGDNNISEYSAESSGSELLRTISESPSSGGVGIRSIAVDSHGYVYAGNLLARDIRVFSRSANGYADPVRTIGGSLTHLGAATGLALDKPDDNLYVTVCQHCSQGSGKDSVLVFAPGARGNVKPSRVISGNKTLLSSPTDLTIRQ